ncbi:5-hydroxytryptamine receptor 1D-like [Acropora palmata]|uniref:5-hydroxytryptamine receptor 1D-like n=1 Tax=Acropora palmata TaxID=6131 RepID=UPI003DA0F5F0
MKNNNTSANDSFTDQDDIAGSDDECLPLGEKNIIRKTSKVTALTSIIVISLIGNVCIVAVTLKTKRMRTATAFKFLMNMAIADLCTTVINMPESLVTEIMDSDQWIPGTMGMVLCKLLPFCQQKRKQPGNFLSSRSESIFSRSRRKTLKMFFAVVICFALCWLPFHVIFFMVTYDREMYICGIPVDLYFVSFFFGHAISALNPCICIIFNKDYRDGLRRIMRK